MCFLYNLPGLSPPDFGFVGAILNKHYIKEEVLHVELHSRNFDNVWLVTKNIPAEFKSI